jgi:pimeloyl-ACP methyl ester carboxylesterase
MANYVELNGIHTWYDEQGTGKSLVLLHPGGVGVDSRAFEPNLPALASHFHVFLPERRGHGHTPDAEGPYRKPSGKAPVIHPGDEPPLL